MFLIKKFPMLKMIPKRVEFRKPLPLHKDSIYSANRQDAKNAKENTDQKNKKIVFYHGFLNFSAIFSSP